MRLLVDAEFEGLRGPPLVDGLARRRGLARHLARGDTVILAENDSN